ncbi:MAG TPA: hypothetical protein VNI84_18950 [Pyrinomonadaceae bacterium]|nr:hypothetical protein [Pyrinomonadaceae bacterium]
MENTEALVPQQNFPPVAATNPAAMQSRRFHPSSIENLFYSWQEQITLEQHKLRQLCEMSVTMQRRYRGLTLSDLCGHYGTRSETRGHFLEYDAELDGEIHPINIVQPALRANTNACLQSNSAVEIKSANASARNKKIAERWQRVADFLERISQDEEERGLIFDAVQKDGTVLVYTYAERAGQSDTIARTHEVSTAYAAYKCDACGGSGMEEVPQDADTEIEEGFAKVPCPTCGAEASGIIKKSSSIEAEDASIEAVNPKHKIYSFFNFTIDGYGAKSKGIDSAKYLQIQELVTRAELETEYPQFNFGSPTVWSYQLQCDYALANSDWNFLNSQYVTGNIFREFERFEKRSIYLHEDAYSNYVAPADYEFVNGRGVSVFSITRGQTIGEAWEARYGFNPRGLKFVWCEERLLDIVSPEEEEINFRRCFGAIHWLRDSSSFYSSPNYSIVIVQDDITLLNTMNHNIIARNAVIPVHYDSLVWEESDFTREYVGSKNAAMMPDRDITKSIFSLPIPTPSPHLSNQLSFMWTVKDSITQVQPALRGESQKGETFGAQRQQLEQSYGLLTAVLKSYAQNRVRVMRQKSEICKDKWTLIQFQRVAGMFGEIWTDGDVTEMCEIDFDSDLIFSYKTGSEMPVSNLAREMNFFQGLSQLLPIVQANPALIETDKMQQLLKKIDEFAGFDFDVTGLEVDEIIAQKRAIELAELCREYADVSVEMIEAARMEIAGVDEQNLPVSSLDLLIEQILHKSNVRFSKYENLQQQGKFFTEQIRIEIGKSQPNSMFIEVLTAVLGMLEQAISQIMLEAQQAQMASDPALIAEKELAAKAAADEKANAESDAENKKADDDTKLEHKLIEKKVDRDADAEKMQLEHALNWQKESAAANEESVSEK